METVDTDIIRPPSLLQHYDAGTCAAVVADPKDLFGLNPSDSVRPKAAFYGYLQATDSHAVNKKVSKWLGVQVRDRNVKNGHCKHKISTPEPVEAGAAPASGTAIGDAMGTEPDPAFAWDADTDSGDDLPPPADNDTAKGADGTNVHMASEGSGDASSSAVGDPSKPFSVHLPQYCCQHMTGNVVEASTKWLGLLSPCFCMASCLSHGDISDALLADIDEIIENSLEVRDPATYMMTPDGEK